MDAQEKQTIGDTLNREYYQLALQSGGDLAAARQAVFDYFAVGIQQGLTVADAVNFLTQRPGGLFTRLGNVLARHEIGQLAEEVKRVDVGELYAAAGVSPERDFEKDPDTGKWRPRMASS
jgi:hypothetical protein